MSDVVSAIIPTYNRADLIGRALDSVAAQDHRPLEAVVIDDGSTDDTESVVEGMRPRLEGAGVMLLYHRQKNGRAPKARNTGMRLATGPLLAFLDSDDLWKPRFCSTLAGLLREHRSAGLAFSGIDVIDAEDRVWKSRDPGLPRHPRSGVLERPFELILRHMPMQTSGVMVRREVIEEVGDFDLGLPVVEDWDLWYRIGKRYDFAYTLEPLACNRCHPDNLPKYDARALNSSLRMNLKHLPDVTDPETRQTLLDRIERQFTLFQEQLLREGKGTADRHSHLLRHELAPRAHPRFGLGSLMARGPQWLGQAYARVVRILGRLRRGIGC